MWKEVGGCWGEGNAARFQWPFQHQQRHGQVFKRDRKQREACLFHQCATPSSLNQVLWTSWMAATDPFPAHPDVGNFRRWETVLQVLIKWMGWLESVL